MRDIFRGFGAVFVKEALHIRRDAGTLFFSLTMPLMQMFLLGFGVDTNIRRVPTVVYNADGRRESRELIDRLKKHPHHKTSRFVFPSPRGNRELHTLDKCKAIAKRAKLDTERFGGRGYCGRDVGNGNVAKFTADGRLELRPYILHQRLGRSACRCFCHPRKP